MGLGANEDGHCSGCDSDHLRPWGTQCLAYKDAIKKCEELNLDPSGYKQYLDLNTVRRAKDLPGLVCAVNLNHLNSIKNTGTVKD